VAPREADMPAGPPPRRLGWLRHLRTDMRPLRTSRDFRLLLASRTLADLMSQVAVVALIVQVKQLTGSPLAVGMLGVAELVPLLATGLYGGVLADRLDRRKIAAWCEAGVIVPFLLLAVNAATPRPRLWLVYAGAAAVTALASLQQPALNAAVPRIVPRDQLTAAAALASITGNAAFIAGPAIGGLLVTGPGPAAAYLFIAVSYATSLAFLLRLRPLPARKHTQDLPGWRSVLAGLRYARGRQELIGSYVVDLAAMIFAFPISLYPFLAEEMHATWALGLMYSATAIGALVASSTSAWTGRVTRHGRAIAIAAVIWGIGIIGFGFAPGIAVALGCLGIAGAADMMSGIFRDTLWNQTIPDAMRGRMAGVELLSYGVGPSAGQARAGLVARITSTRFSLWSGGVVCVAAVGLICLALPRFVRYDAPAGRGLASPVGGTPEVHRQAAPDHAAG
jgi:MFS family permease